ncbi:hypothetical protein ACE193_03340 [Bernardetia sp. OM2101]|uniref:hypothetical protein n=1 Tax=Bernardetia sp. OM2101 TaxID=3344876 RepID=UPI0035CF1460
MRTYKHHFYLSLLILFLVCFGSIQTVFSQTINVNVTVIPPYPIYLENYINRGNSVIITLTNTSAETQQIRLIPSLEGNNGVSIKVKESYFPTAPIILNPRQTRTFTYNQLQSFNANLTENDVQIQGVSVSTLAQNEALPEGSYSLCIKAFEFQNSNLLSSEFGCASILITNYDPPIMVLPLDEAKINPSTPQFVNFVWTPAGVPSKTRYHLKIVDMSANNLFNINDAFNNPSIQIYFEKDNIITNTFSYTLAMPPLQKGRKYAIRVTAYDPSNSIQFKNQGHSPVTSFTYDDDKIVVDGDNDDDDDDNNGDDENPIPDDIVVIIDNDDLPNDDDNPNIPKDPQDSPECMAACQIVAPTPSAPLKLSVGQEIIAGKFKMKITSINGNNSGEGTILVAFLNAPIKVKFNNLKVNNSFQLFDGNIYAKVDNQSLVSQAVSENPNADLQSIASKAKQINQFLGNASRQVSKLGGNVPIGLPLSLDNNNYNLAIVGIIFSPTEAKMHTVLGVEIPQVLQNDLFTLTGTGLGIRPNGFCADTEGRISLSSDKTLKLSNDLVLILEKGQQNTYANFSCKGIEKVALKGNLEWSRNKILPYQYNKVVQNENKKLKATFQTEIEQVGDWIFEAAFNYPSFVLPSAQNLVFAAPSLSLDLSGKKTPTAVKQKHQKGNDWVGIYIQNLSVTLPKVFEKNKQPLVLEANEFIIDKLGFSGKINASGELLSLNDGSVDDWAISLQKFGITLKNSSLSGGLMEGKVKIPLTDEALSYEGSIAQANQQGDANFEFSVITNEDYSVSAWIATLDLEQDSKVTIKKDNSNKWHVDAVLNGAVSIGWEDGKAKNSEGQEEELKENNVSSFSLPNIRFEQLALKSGSNKLIESFTKFALENPNEEQSRLADFPLSFNPEKPLELVSQQKGGGEIYGIKLSPELTLINLANGIKGGATFTVFSKYNKNTKKLTYEETSLNSINIDANIGVAHFIGEVDIYKQDLTFGNGFRGAVSVDIQKLVKVDATLQIGKTLSIKNKNNVVTEEGFRYWYFDAMALLKTGIPMTTSLSAYGFGGGAWYNMKRGETPKAVSYEQFETVDFDPNSEAGQTVSGTTFTPQKDKFGFKANMVLGLSGGSDAASSFNADLGFEVFMRKDNEKGLALDSLILKGDGYFMQPIDLPMAEKINAVASASVRIKVDAIKPAFNMAGAINIKAGDVVQGNGNLELHFEPNKWYLNLGKWSKSQAMQDEPWNDKSRLNMNIDLKVTTLSYNGYFMMGTHIPQYLPSVPKKIRQTLNLPISQKAQYQEAQEGKGFAMGLGFRRALDAKFLFLYADFELFAGFDILLAKYSDETLCNNKSDFGINKWRAKGQAYGYFGGEAGFKGKLFGKEREFKIIDLKSAALVEVEAPNPSYLGGNFVVKGGLLGNRIKINMDFEFEFGEKCEFTGQGNKNPFDDYPLISQIAPKEGSKKASVMTDPSVSFNLGIGRDESQGITKYYSNNTYKLVVPAENEDEQDEVSTVYVRLQKAELSYQEGGKKIMVEGKTKFDKYQKEAYFVAKEALKPTTKYTFYVEVSGWEIENNIHTKLATQHKSTSFTTNEGLEEIPQDQIVSAEPFARSRYAFKGARWGNVKLTKSICDQPLFKKLHISEGSTIFVARFTDLKTGESIDTDKVNCTFDQVNFQVPQLKGSTIYEISIVRIDKEGNNNLSAGANTSQIEKNIGGSSMAYYTALKGSRNSKKQVETKLLTYHFRTGKYNKMIDKMNKMSIKQAELATISIGNNQRAEVAMIALECDEPIDVVDAYGYVQDTRILGFGTNLDLTPPTTNGISLMTAYQNTNQFPQEYAKQHFRPSILKAKYGEGILNFVPTFHPTRYYGLYNFGSNKTFQSPIYNLEARNTVMFYRPHYQKVYRVGSNRNSSNYPSSLFKPKGITYTLPKTPISPYEIQQARAKAPKQNLNLGGLNLQINVPKPPKSQFDNNLGFDSNTKYYIPIIEYRNYILARDIKKLQSFAHNKALNVKSHFLQNGHYKGITPSKYQSFYTSFERPLYLLGSHKYTITLEGRTFTYNVKK